MFALVHGQPAQFVEDGYDLVDVYTHRDGKIVATANLITPTDEPRTHRSIQLDDYEPRGIERAATELNRSGFHVFRIVPHRHGNQVRATVHGLGPYEPIEREWRVVQAADHYESADGAIVQLLQEGWGLHTILPHRIGSDNVALIVAFRHRS